MKKIRKHFVSVVLTVGLLAVCIGGCSQDSNSENQNETLPNSSQSVSDTLNSQENESSLQESSVVSDKESSKEQSSSDISKADEKQALTEKVIEEINILNDFKNKIEPVKTITVNFSTDDGGFRDSEQTGKVYFVDAVIRDINNDGHYEMIVKYDCRNLWWHSTESSPDIYVDTPSYIYDVVKVVNGKAVETEHYKNEEGWYNPGEAN